MKKIIVFLTTALCFFPINKAMAQSGPTGDCTWTLTGTSPNYTLTISGNGAMGDYANFIDIPWFSYVNNIKTVDIQQGVTSIGNAAFNECIGLTSVTIPNSVTSIGNSAFFHCSSLTSVTIPNSVTSIGNSVFSFCEGLTSVTIPNSLTSIRDNAFYNCIGLTSVTIPNSVTSIGNYAFSFCVGLTSVTIPNSLISIGNYAFSFCVGLTSVTIPNSVTSIGNVAFSSCNNLTSISVDVNNTTYSSNGGVLFNKNQTTLICCPAGKTGNYTIPSTVTVIEANAFDDCDGLTSITIPNSVTTIGDYAFRNCTNLTAFSVNGSNTAFSSNSGVLFNKNQTTLIRCPIGKTGNYTIPSTVTAIGDLAFLYCSGLTSITIPNSVTTIGNGAFYACGGLTSISIPNAVTTIGKEAFHRCSGLTSLNIGNSVTTIGDLAFRYCTGLTSISIPNSVTTIGDYAFDRCSGLTGTLTIPNSVISIGVQAFDSCRYVKKLILGSGLATIGSGAFSESPLDTLIVLSVNPPVLGDGDGVFRCSYYGNDYGVQDPSIPVYVPCGSKTSYEGAYGWNYFINIMENPFYIRVTSNDNTMGSANVTQRNTCTNNTAIIVAISNPTYRFVQWNDGIKDNPRTVTLTSDTTFTAVFGSQGLFHITVLANNQNMGTVIGSGDYVQDTTISIVAVAYAGYHFVQWDDKNNSNPRQIIVTQDRTFVATFDVGNDITDLKTSTINVYPNPTTDNITVTLPENVDQAVFTLYDMQGKVLIRQEIGNQDAVSVNNLAAGIYIYNVITDKKSYTGKLIINN